MVQQKEQDHFACIKDGLRAVGGDQRLREVLAEFNFPELLESAEVCIVHKKGSKLLFMETADCLHDLSLAISEMESQTDSKAIHDLGVEIGSLAAYLRLMAP